MRKLRKSAFVAALGALGAFAKLDD